jgi:hypothetical protein
MSLQAWTVWSDALTNLALLQGRTPGPGETAAAGATSCAACGTCGAGMTAFVAIPIVFFVLNIALLIWVARDAKARGLDNSVMWMILVFFTSFIGLIIYIYSRPQGMLVSCASCKNKRLQSSAKCPTCGNP